MNLYFEMERADAYNSGSQRARVLTEPWIARQVYCPNCGNFPLFRHPNNSPVGDFYCSRCTENYELKSKRAGFGAKVDDGGYRVMLQRLSGNAIPNLFLLNYNVASFAVTNLTIIPKHFFTAEMIEKRKPLPPTARRKGWIGCRILLQAIPHSGRIDIVRNGVIEPKAIVLDNWQRTLFLGKQRDLEAKGWLVHVMRCIERISKSRFSLDEVYAFEHELAAAHPGNQHIRPKIRQKLQVLRDNGYLEFLGKGDYRIVGSAS
jgi:type II restriction enzyme